MARFWVGERWGSLSTSSGLVKPTAGRMPRASAALSAGAKLAERRGDWERAYALRQQFLRANPTDPFAHRPELGEQLRAALNGG